MSDEKPTDATEPGESPAEDSTKVKDEKDASFEAKGSAEPAKDEKDASAEPAKGEKDSSAEPAKGEKNSSAEPAKAVEEKKGKETWSSTFIWLAAIVFLLGVELYFYGHDGRIQVCVGIDGLTDYATKDEPRTKANAVKHPFCAERLNLGMWTKSEEMSKAALNEACSAAVRVLGQEHRQKCLRRDDPWTRFMETEHIMPWDARLYRRLLWLD